MIDYDVRKDNWYSPKKIIEEFEKLRNQFGDYLSSENDLFKRANEMYEGAITLLGVYELDSENKYWMQSNNQTESPDVVACVQREGGEHGIDLLINQMEMVKMEQHSPTNDIVEFLKQTKLSSRKNYTKYDLIVLFINRETPYNQEEINKQLIKLNPKSTIYIVGSPIDANIGEFIIFTPYPILYKPIRFNISETIKKYWIPEVVSFDRKLDKKIRYEKSDSLKSYNTYEVLGLDQNKIYKKFGIKK